MMLEGGRTLHAPIPLSLQLPITLPFPSSCLSCSACRVVWYCSTACSHADWREGGHRRMCRALGAARRAAKEAAVAEAASSAAAEVQEGS